MNMFDQLQSSYKDKYSMATAQNKICSELYTDPLTILLMLDLSATLDTIDHTILLVELCNVYGITDNVPQWFRCYHSDMIQHIAM